MRLTAGIEFFKIALGLTMQMYALPPPKSTLLVELPARVESQKAWKLGHRDGSTTPEQKQSTTYEHHETARSIRFTGAKVGSLLYAWAFP